MTNLIRCEYRGAAILAAVLLSSVLGYGYPGGVTGKTLKGGVATGCGGCHGSSATPSVIVSVNGPARVSPGTAVTETLSVSGGPASGAGCDIATTRGTLAVISTTLKLSSGELVQNASTAMPGGRALFVFRYTAPASAGTDTIFAIGLSDNNGNGANGDNWNWAPKKVITVSNATGVGTDPGDELPTQFALEQNYPNPFNPTTLIRYALPKESHVTLTVYSVIGQEVAKLVDEVQPAGYKEVVWDGAGFSSGIYFFQLNAGDFTQIRKMLVVR
jgi:hypothetical protein